MPSHETPPCCLNCQEFIESAFCNLLRERRVGDWVDDMPCRVDAQIRAIALRIRNRSEEVDDLVQETLVRIMEASGRPNCIIPDRPREAFAWVRTAARRIAIDDARRSAREKQGYSGRAKCGLCDFYDAKRKRCVCSNGMDEVSFAPIRNPLDGQAVDPNGKPACGQGQHSFFRPRYEPSRTEYPEEGVARTAGDPSDLAAVRESWERLGVDDPRGMMALGIRLKGGEDEDIARELGISPRTTYRILENARDQFLSFLEVRLTRE